MPNRSGKLICLLGQTGLGPGDLEKLAFETGFYKRAKRKVSASDFLIHLCLESLKGTVSYNDLASRIQIKAGISASRQAYWEKTNDACVIFFQAVLERVISAKSDFAQLRRKMNATRFKRILLQDSTVIQLPLRLFPAFSGVRNAKCAVCNARIQGIYEVISGRFIKFSVDPYSKNDLMAALDIPIQPGDLVLRDRGYFKFEAIAAQYRAGADTITRFKTSTSLHDPNTGEEIDLLKLLKLHSAIDKSVLVGSANPIQMRLVAVAVDQETVNLRRMKAKRQAHGHRVSKKVLQLMAWTIFLTTISDPQIEFQEILELYALRWRIENIIKTWKSNFSFTKIHNVSQRQLRILLTARLIMITIIYHKFYSPLNRIIKHHTGRHLSLMKFMHHVSRNTNILPHLTRPTNSTIKALARYCTYDKRKRLNFSSRLEIIIRRNNEIHALT